MANYLPVLLVSVSTNANVPDDSTLTTAPRAQVDYLSHEWQEEDVWRSWRNMTRQKNAIANGARLENASWRTWWKQRNNLGTVSPETLNWLKDSDVTWLYGPLHTATEWKPPPPTTSRAPSPSTGQNSFLRTAQYKPILKHRSISELLTSDLPPTSPMFSPVDSEEEDDGSDDPTVAAPSAPATVRDDIHPKRPPLMHTKSDTHITRWGPSRAFRKDSPPRIDPPGIDNPVSKTPIIPSSIVTPASRSASSQQISAAGPIRASLSQDSSSSGSGGISAERALGTQKKKHISFNTFVEQCIAIEKPKKNASGYFGAIPEGTWMGARTRWVEDDGYDEDQEDSDEEAAVLVHAAKWDSEKVPAIRSGSESPLDDEEEEEDDEVIEIRSTSSTLRPKMRSQSKVSTTSSSSTSTTASSSSASTQSSSNTTSTSSPSGSLSPSRRTSSSSALPRKSSSSSLAPTLSASNLYRRSSASAATSTYRPSAHRIPRPPPLVRRTSDNGSYSTTSSSRSQTSQHVTIAPIAPTLLKTTPTPSWMESLGDEGADAGLSQGDDGFAGWAWGIGGKVSNPNEEGAEDEKEQRDGGSSLPRRRSWTSGEGYGSMFGIAHQGRGGSMRGMGFGPPMPAGAGEAGPAMMRDMIELMDNDPDAQGSDGTPVELVYVPPYEYGFVDADVLEDEQGEAEAGRVEEGTTYHHSSITGSVVTISTSPLAIDSVTPSLPTVVVDADGGTPTTATSKRTRTTKLSPDLAQDGQEEDAYDYFGGPDLGDGYYYYARRAGGGRGGSAPSTPYYEGGSGSGGRSNGRTSTGKPAPPTPSADVRQRERQRERKQVGQGEARQSRSRSRSESRTPSPAMMSSTSPVDAPSSVPAARGRSQSASAPGANGMSTAKRTPSYSELLSPPSRGRQSQTQGQQDDRRGRSSTRNSSSSSSWDRERRQSAGSSGSLSTSPMGSLSPDGLGSPTHAGRNGVGVGVGLGAVLGGGWVEKEKEKERERGRGRTSSKVLGAASASTTPTPASPPKIQTNVSMDSSFISTNSSSSSGTVVPPPTVVPPAQEEPPVDPELVYMRRAEEELRRKTHPTPSNSPIMEMRMAGVWGAGGPVGGTPVGSRSGSTSAGSSTPTQSSQAEKEVLGGVEPIATPRHVLPSSPTSKLRPPSTLISAPPSPAKPSTSFMAAVSPSPGVVSPGVAGNPADTTIVGKAVDIVSSAGAYFGLWVKEKDASSPPL